MYACNNCQFDACPRFNTMYRFCIFIPNQKAWTYRIILSLSYECKKFDVHRLMSSRDSKRRQNPGNCPSVSKVAEFNYTCVYMQSEMNSINETCQSLILSTGRWSEVNLHGVVVSFFSPVSISLTSSSWPIGHHWTISWWNPAFVPLVMSERIQLSDLGMIQEQEDCN